MKRDPDKKRGSYDTEKGFTLVELLFVLLLLPLLFLSIYMVIDMANVIFRTSGGYSQLNHSAMQTLRYVAREIGQTSPLALPSHLSIALDGAGNNVVTFQIPVDWDNDGDAVTGSMNPAAEWGAYNDVGQTQSGNLDFWAQYQVVNNQLMRRVLDQSQNLVAGSERIVANNIQAFLVNQTGDELSITVILSVTDNLGQAGAPRTLSSTFTSRTLLRNAVN